jgi:hypothetical protein
MHGDRKEADKRLLLINPTRSPHLLAPALRRAVQVADARRRQYVIAMADLQQFIRWWSSTTARIYGSAVGSRAAAHRPLKPQRRGLVQLHSEHMISCTEFSKKHTMLCRALTNLCTRTKFSKKHTMLCRALTKRYTYIFVNCCILSW